jgi:hypothetical protein
MGVAGVVKFGTVPARCPDEEIARLIASADPDEIIRLPARPEAYLQATAGPQRHFSLVKNLAMGAVSVAIRGCHQANAG